MSTVTGVKPPVSFWILSVLALIWNLFGVMAYLSSVYMTDEMKAAMTADQLNLAESTPVWATAAFAIATWGGLLGCIALVFRKKWASLVFFLSFIAIVIQLGHAFLMTNVTEVYGLLQGLVLPLFVLLIGLSLLLYSRYAERRNWTV